VGTRWHAVHHGVMRIHQIATAPPVTCAPDQSISAVARIMREQDVGAVVVTDADGRLRGIVTDRDLVVRGLARGLSTDAAVEHVMTHDVVHVEASAELDAGLNHMQAWGVRRLPVVDADGTLRGIVTLDDLLLVLEQEEELAAGPVRSAVSAGRRGHAFVPRVDLTGAPTEPVEAPAVTADVPSGW